MTYNGSWRCEQKGAPRNEKHKGCTRHGMFLIVLLLTASVAVAVLVSRLSCALGAMGWFSGLAWCSAGVGALGISFGVLLFVFQDRLLYIPSMPIRDPDDNPNGAYVQVLVPGTLGSAVNSNVESVPMLSLLGVSYLYCSCLPAVVTACCPRCFFPIGVCILVPKNIPGVRVLLTSTQCDMCVCLSCCTSTRTATLYCAASYWAVRRTWEDGQHTAVVLPTARHGSRQQKRYEQVGFLALYFSHQQRGNPPIPMQSATISLQHILRVNLV